MNYDTELRRVLNKRNLNALNNFINTREELRELKPYWNKMTTDNKLIVLNKTIIDNENVDFEIRKKARSWLAFNTFGYGVHGSKFKKFKEEE